MPGSAMIGNLAVNLSLETAAFQQGATIAQKRMQAFGDQMQSVGKRITQFGTIATAGLTLPLAAFAKKSFDAAKDAAELQSAFDATFGSMAGAMNKWAEATGNAMGRSTREMQEGANTFGLYFNQLGKAPAEAAKMSQAFTILAQDLASFHNTDVETAIQSLRSGLSGEAEPMRKFGVFLSEAAVSAKAAELGIGTLGQKLTETEKIAARYAIIMDKTKTAQGDVGRTSGSTANQIREAEAAWEELQITVGTKLLPALTPLITALGNMLEKFNQLSPTTQSWVVGIGAAAAALGPLMLAVGPIVMGLGALLPLIVKLAPAFVALRVAALALLANPVFLGAAAAITAIYLAWKNWDKITAIVGRMVAGVKAHLGSLTGVLKAALNPIQTVQKAFYTLYDKVVGNSYIPDMVDEIGAQMRRLDAVMVEPVKNATDKAANAFRALQQETAALLDEIFPEQKAANDFSAKITVLENAARKGIITIDQLKASLEALYDTLPKGDVIPTVEAVVDVPDPVAKVRNPLEEWAASIPHTAAQITTSLQGIAAHGLDSLANGVTDVITGAKSLGDAFKDIAKSIIGDLVAMIAKMLIFRAISAAFPGLFPAGGTPANVPGMAGGGFGTFGGFGGIDKNILSLNGSPIARVSKGEQFSVSPANDVGPTRVLVELNDGMLSARITEGAGQVVMRAAPIIRSDTMRAIGDRNRRRG